MIDGVKISIVTPVYNRENVVARCIDSVLKQAYKNFELIVIDDGSSDGTVDILKAYGPQFKLLINDGNKGVNFSRNRCIAEATGDYVLLLDSDDYLVEDALTSVARAIETARLCKHFLFSVDYRVEEYSLLNKKSIFTYEDWLSGEVSGDFVHVVKREIFDGRSFFEEFRAAEQLNWLRIYKECGEQVFFNFAVIVVDRSSDDSLSKSGTLVNVSVMLEQLQVRLKYLELYGDDLKAFNSGEYFNYIKKSVLLAICVKHFHVSKRMIFLLSNRFDIFKFSVINNSVFSMLIRHSIFLRGVIRRGL